MKRINILFLFVLLSVFFSICFSVLAEFLNPGATTRVDFYKDRIIDKFIVLIFIAPFLETLLLNYLPFKVLNKFKCNNCLIIIISSLIFSLLHNYSCVYMIFAFFSGLIINSFFMIIYKQSDEIISSFYTFLLHSLYNLIIFLLNDIFNIF